VYISLWYNKGKPIQGVLNMSLLKDEAKRIIEDLPENATWDDLMYQLYVKKRVETGLKEVENGQTMTHEEVKKRLLS
jgi:predicted transcriptional regulator